MKHSIDTAMGSLWDFYRKRFLSLFLISFVMSLVIQYVSTFVDLQELTGITDPALMLGKIKEIIVPILIISLVNLLFNVILQHYIIFNPLNSENNIFVSALKSLRYFLPYLVVIVLLALAASIAIVLGVLLLIVGVILAIIYIMTLYLFILPIMMSEDTDIGSTATRTITLAHRNFWSNMGWVSVFLIILIVISVIASGLILLPFTGSFIKTIANPGEANELFSMAKNPLFLVLSALAGALTMPLIPLFSCILYFNSKAREETSPEETVNEHDPNRIRVEDLYAKPYADDHPDNPENKSGDDQLR